LPYAVVSGGYTRTRTHGALSYMHGRVLHSHIRKVRRPGYV